VKLSIIVPVYNMATGGKLAYCLDSLLNQTIDDYEIIAVDDCSTDTSRQILAEYGRRHPQRLRVILSPENRRQGGAKNLGLEIATGAWIGFVDADDWVSADCYELMLNEAKASGADMVGCDLYHVDKQGMEPGRLVSHNDTAQTGELDAAKYRLLILDGGHLVTKIFRREIIFGHENRFPEKMFYEDNAIAISWMLRAKHFAHVAKPLYYYYQHPGSTVHVTTKERCLDRMAAGRIMLKEAQDFGYYDTYLPEIEYRFTEMFYLNTLFSYVRGLKCPSVRFVRALGEEMLEHFPRFMENPYYLSRKDAEEQKMAALQLKSPLWFVVYYKLLWWYRGWKFV